MWVGYFGLCAFEYFKFLGLSRNLRVASLLMLIKQERLAVFQNYTF